MKKYNLLLCYALAAASLVAQPNKTREAVRLSCAPVIDGQLADSCWQSLQPLEAFATSTPVFGLKPAGRTEVRIFYTETAFYVAAHCFTPSAGKIRLDGGIRDGERTGDWFQVSLDTWNDDQLSFDFTVSAAGVQYDTRSTSGWDANWQSAVSLQADGWTVEMRIPLTALRFPQKAEQNWGLQLTRFDRSTGETSTWNPRNPLVQDRVLQFGTLTGLRDLHQLRRLALGAYLNSNLRTQTKPFEVNDITETAGLDGRVGLNSKATLDFTLLPPMRVTIDWRSIFQPVEIEKTFNISITEPRQFIQEERDLFDQEYALNYSPIVWGHQVLGNRPLNPGETYVNATNSKLLQASKLTARTEGNWRFGVYNALLGPVKATFRNDSLERVSGRTLQALSDFNYMSAEYLLRNNSYIQVSNAGLLAGPNLTTLAPQFSFRLRDRSNSLEANGMARMNYQKTDTLRVQNYHYRLGIARVNRRWGWEASFEEYYTPVQKATPGGSLNGNARAAVTYRSFRPRGPFLNVEAMAGTFLNYNGSIALPEVKLGINLFGHIGATDRRFQRYSLDLYTKPYSSKIRYDKGGTYLYQEIAPVVSGNLGYTSDQRKRFIGSANVYVSASTKGEMPLLYAGIRPQWVLSRHLTAEAAWESRASFERLRVLSTFNDWAFERHNEWNHAIRLGIRWYPADRLMAYGSMSATAIRYTKREAVTLQNDGQLTPSDLPLSPPWSPTVGEAHVGLQYFFTPTSYVRFQHIFGDYNTLYFDTPQPGAQNRLNGTTDLTVVYFLDGAGRR
jgi:hypothetical protein